MIYHDTVTVAQQVPYDPPQYSEFGEPIYDHTTETVAAEVFPLDTDAVLSVTGEIVTSRYRMVLASGVDIPPRIGTTSASAGGHSRSTPTTRSATTAAYSSTAPSNDTCSAAGYTTTS